MTRISEACSTQGPQKRTKSSGETRVGTASTRRRVPRHDCKRHEMRQRKKSKLVGNRGGIVTGRRESDGSGGAVGPEEEEEGVAVAATAEA
jgi:hypothetical protein